MVKIRVEPVYLWYCEDCGANEWAEEAQMDIESAIEQGKSKHKYCDGGESLNK